MYAEFHPDADQEFSEHAVFYELREPGLGDRFIAEVEAGIAILVSQPLIGPQFDKDFRLFVLDEFPFSLIYSFDTDRIWILAVAHQSRRPGYWRKRSA